MPFFPFVSKRYLKTVYNDSSQNASPIKNLKYLQITVILVLADGYYQGWLVCPTAKCRIGSLLSPILSHNRSSKEAHDLQSWEELDTPER